jgi:hypothetical protein
MCTQAVVLAVTSLRRSVDNAGSGKRTQSSMRA